MQRNAAAFCILQFGFIIGGTDMGIYQVYQESCVHTPSFELSIFSQTFRADLSSAEVGRYRFYRRPSPTSYLILQYSN